MPLIPQKQKCLSMLKIVQDCCPSVLILGKEVSLLWGEATMYGCVPKLVIVWASVFNASKYDL